MIERPGSARPPEQKPPPDHSSTAEQLARVRSGDPSGFAKLYGRTAPALHGWAALRIHPELRARLDPDDLVQEVWWRAMDSFGTYDPAKGSFRTWLFRIATNVLLDAFRRLRSKRPDDDAAGLKAARRTRPEALIAEGTSICLQVSRNETISRMIAAVSAMDADDRALFVHCALEGLTVGEASPLIGLGEAAGAKRWQRLKARLRESPDWRAFLVDLGDA